MSIITEDTLKMETQIIRCKMGVKEYFNAAAIRIDYKGLFKKLDPPCLLFQFAHEIAFKKKDWQEALRWVHDNRGAIMAYAAGKTDEWGDDIHEQAVATTAETNRAANGIDVGTTREGQPLCVGDDGLPVERKKETT